VFVRDSEIEIRRVLPEGHSAVQCLVMDERSVWRDRWPPKIWICFKCSQKMHFSCGALHFNRKYKLNLYILKELKSIATQLNHSLMRTNFTLGD